MSARAIVHLDADAFFASVEQAADPRLRGKAIAVGGEKRGIIASASYEARRFGIYTPMPTMRARRLCPKLIILPGDYDKYEQFSRWMFSYAHDFTPDVEVGSIDEGYLDLTGARKSSTEIAETLRTAIKQSLKISVSEGIGSNKLISQIASKLKKPSCFIHVPLGGEIHFLHPLENRWLPGIGPKTAERLNNAGLARISQIAATPVDLLSLLLGRSALQTREFAHGRDERPVVRESAPAKSYGQQETFGQDTVDEEFVEATLRRMADELMSKVRQDGKTVRTVTVKVRYNDMAEDQCSETLTEPTDLESDLYSRFRLMLKRAWKRRVSLRLVSLRFTNLYEGFVRIELPLDTDAQHHEARRRLAQVVDKLRESRGCKVIMRGHDLLLAGRFEDNGRRSTALIKPVQSHRIMTGFVPLNVHSYYSFLNSTLSIQAIVDLATRHELPAIALTDTGNIHGAVEFFSAAKAAGIKPIVGAEVRWGPSPLLLYVKNKLGYRNLCRILTSHKPMAVVFDEIGTEGLIGVGSDPHLERYFSDRFYLASGVACPAVHHADRTDRWKYDVVQSIRTLTLLHQKHPDKRLGGDNHFPTATEMCELYDGREHMLTATMEIAERCEFDFELGKLQFPSFVPPDGSTPRMFLQELVRTGLKWRYPHAHDEMRPQVAVMRLLSHHTFNELNKHFSEVWDTKQFQANKWGEAFRWNAARREAGEVFQSLWPELSVRERPLSWQTKTERKKSA
jgi:DNA polymerase-4